MNMSTTTTTMASTSSRATAASSAPRRRPPSTPTTLTPRVTRGNYWPSWWTPTTIRSCWRTDTPSTHSVRKSKKNTEFKLQNNKAARKHSKGGNWKSQKLIRSKAGEERKGRKKENREENNLLLQRRQLALSARALENIKNTGITYCIVS